MRVRKKAFVLDDRCIHALAAVFDTSPEPVRAVRVTQHSVFALLHRARAVTRRNAIYLSGSGAVFAADPELILHEYFHVLRQWKTGELTIARYIAEWVRQGFCYERIRYEVEARAFAARNVGRYRSLLG